MTKWCATCDTVKDIEAFGNCKSAGDGKQSKCRECQSKYYKAWQAKVKNSPKKTPIQKVCHRCGKKKTADEFFKASSRPDGLQSACAVCAVEYYNKWYQGHKAKKAAAG
jgi:hypothetical protein